MNSQVHYTTEIGRIRMEEAQARAARYRLEQGAKIRAQRGSAPSRPMLVIYKKALKIAALSVTVTGLAVIVS